MNHGQHKPNVENSSVSQSQQKEKHSDYPNGSRTDEKTRIITVNTTSLTQGDISSWTPHKMSLQDNSWKIVNSSSPKKVSTSSCPVFFWEVLMTVALLIMALWMQGLPAKQIPHSTDRDTLPSFEITKPQMEF
ncbi:MAG: hypothetical protein QNJ33_19215 [Crocosphaera sp.]|nr:hypothetical protein [Crocosphaera sp.]